MGLNKQERAAEKEIRLQKKREKRRIANRQFDNLVKKGLFDEIETEEKFHKKGNNHGN